MRGPTGPFGEEERGEAKMTSLQKGLFTAETAEYAEQYY